MNPRLGLITLALGLLGLMTGLSLAFWDLHRARIRGHFPRHWQIYHYLLFKCDGRMIHREIVLFGSPLLLGLVAGIALDSL